MIEPVWPLKTLTLSFEAGDQSKAISSSSAQLASKNPEGSHLIIPIDEVWPLHILLGYSYYKVQRHMVLSEWLEAKSVELYQSISVTSESYLNERPFI